MAPARATCRTGAIDFWLLGGLPFCLSGRWGQSFRQLKASDKSGVFLCVEGYIINGFYATLKSNTALISHN